MAALLLPLVVATALATPPTTVRTSAAYLPFHVTQPIRRTLGVECQDPDQVAPLSARCLVADVTAGALGSGDEVVLGDDDCGTVSTLSTDPITSQLALRLPVTYAFDVASPVAGHRYAYAVRCTDGDGEEGTFFQESVYDDAPPVLEILTGPRRNGFLTSADFDATCTDAAFLADWSFTDGPDPDALPDFLPSCTMTCAVYRYGQPTPVVGPSACGSRTVQSSASASHFLVTGLGPGRYRLELSGLDDVGLEATPVSYDWRILRTPPDTGGWYEDTAWAVDSDTGWPFGDGHPDDTDVADTLVADSDVETDRLPSDSDLQPPGTDDPPLCGCSTSAPSGPWGLLALLGLAVRRRRR